MWRGSETIYILRNKTSHVISIDSYSTRLGKDNVLASKQIILPPNEFHEQKSVNGETYFSETSIDSVRISFNDEKLLVLTCKDLRNTESCHPIFNGDIEFSITEEDYKKAVPIEEE